MIVDSSPDPEKRGVETARAGSIDNPEGVTSYNAHDNRETDFMTRNGLNLKSFGRRKSYHLVQFQCALTIL